MTTEPSRIEDRPRSICLENARTARKNARKIARPPMRGIGTLCIRRLSFGTSMTPIFCASILTSGVAPKEITNALTSVRPVRIMKCRSRFMAAPQRATKPTRL